MWSFWGILILLALFSKTGFSTFDKSRTAILRAVIPFGIIIHHISQGQGIFFDFLTFGPYGVGLFFFISGYGLQAKHQFKRVKVKELKERYIKLFTPLLIPSILYLLLVLMNGGSVSKTIWGGLLNWNIILPFTWFFIVLSFLYLLFYLVYYFTDNPRLRLGIIGFCIISIMGISYLTQIPTTFWCSLLAFPAGIAYRLHESSLISYTARLKLLVLTIIATIIGLVLHSAHFFKGLDEILIPILAITAVVFSCFLPEPGKRSPIFLFSTISYEMYVCQGISFFIINKVSIENPYIYFILIFAVNIPIALGCHMLSKQLFSHHNAEKTEKDIS